MCRPVVRGNKMQSGSGWQVQGAESMVRSWLGVGWLPSLCACMWVCMRTSAHTEIHILKCVGTYTFISVLFSLILPVSFSLLRAYHLTHQTIPFFQVSQSYPHPSRSVSTCWLLCASFTECPRSGGRPHASSDVIGSPDWVFLSVASSF